MRDLLERISGLKLLVIGDLLLDHYIWGDASRISPEAPVPVVAVERDSFRAGGAANVALNLKALGCATRLSGVVGKDPSGDCLTQMLKEKNVQWDNSFSKKGVPTILKTRVIARRQQLCRLDRELPPAHYAMDGERDRKAIAKRVQKADAVILSDYAKGVITDPLLETVIEEAGKKGTIVAYDPKPKRRLHLEGIDLITPNRTEALELAGLETGPHEDYPAEAVCANIWRRFEPRYLIITLGSEGMLLSAEGRVLRRIPTSAREVFDVSGAGDTVIAALTAALAAGAGMEEAAHFANLAAGVVVGKFGTSIASPDEILACQAAHE